MTFAADVNGSYSGSAAVLHNVLFGETWVCGGQSNMEYNVGGRLIVHVHAVTPPQPQPLLSGWHPALLTDVRLMPIG